jgi:hypothetical protein
MTKVVASMKSRKNGRMKLSEISFHACVDRVTSELNTATGAGFGSVVQNSRTARQFRPVYFSCYTGARISGVAALLKSRNRL